jgi:hypothetical protein
MHTYTNLKSHQDKKIWVEKGDMSGKTERMVAPEYLDTIHMSVPCCEYRNG